MAAAASARSLRAEASDRSAEDGIRRADRCLAPRAVAGMGRHAAGAFAPCRRWFRACLAGPPSVAGAPRRHTQLAISAVDGVDAAGLAREVGVRPAKIVFVTSDLFVGGGAEGMLVRMVTAKPPLADEITVVSLLPGESHVERLHAA